MKTIENKVVNSVEQTGNVNISVFKGSRKIDEFNVHNTGTLDLCKYLRDALTGENVIAYRPGRIVPCRRKKGTTNVLEPMFTYGVQYLPESMDNRADDGFFSAWLDMGFIIPNTLLNDEDKIVGFRLCRNILDDRGNLVTYAEIDFENQGYEPIVISGDMSIRVDWRLKISIVSSTSEEEF